MRPGRETAERSEMVVGRGGSKPLLLEGALPREHIAFEERTNAVVSVTLGEKVGEAIEMQGDLLGNGGGADTNHGEGEVAGHPGGEGVRNGIMKGIGEARHLS